jgi:hypothetical protein
MTTENVDGQLIWPWDHYNRQLVAHVHPSDWNNPEPQRRLPECRVRSVKDLDPLVPCDGRHRPCIAVWYPCDRDKM